VLNVLDVFCGAGGFSEGFRQAGFRIAAGTDIDPDACATYTYNFPDAVTVCGDLTKEATRARVVEAAGAVDVVVGGPPCQAFSQVRNHDRALNDPRNRLYREFLRLLKRVQPRAFVMENVPGLAQLRVQERIAKDLVLDGKYRVSVQEVDACDFGVPQTRKRLLFVGLNSSLGTCPEVLRGSRASECLLLARTENGSVGYEPAPSGLDGRQFLARLLDTGDASIVTTRQAISDLAVLRPGRRDDDLPDEDLPAPESSYQRIMRNACAVSNVSVPRINEDTILRLSAIPQGGNYLDLPHGLRDRYLTGQRWGPHNGSGRLGRRHYYAYRRLHPDFWAWTLNTKADSSYHWHAERALSVREFARIQSFPDHFKFTTDSRRGSIPGRIAGGAAHSRYRQVGNAVPPLLALAVARQLLAVLSPDSVAPKPGSST
jgi:DNA (cytosine-5)-methyltransferase 1